MRISKILTRFLLFALAPILAIGQQLSFKSESEKSQVSSGEAFRVGFFIESNTDGYSIDEPMKYPPHKGLKIVGEQRAQNVSYINGKGVIEEGIILSFVAEKEGNYKIGPAKITINGKTYSTKPIDILVKGTNLSHENFKRNDHQPAFLQSKVSKTTPYVNEQVGLSVKLYVKDLSYLNRKQNFRQGSLDGLSPKIVKNSPENIKQEIVGGKQYFSEEIARYYVFPQKPGKIEIDPFSVDVVLPTTYGAEPVEIRSNPVIINVKPLPEHGKPKNFSGAVGQFKINTAIDKKELSENESVNLDLEIIGAGNFNSINLPEIKYPKDLESFSLKKRDAYKTYDTGMKGKIVGQTVLVPSSQGSYTISPVEFNYFDPIKEKYVTLKSDPINLKVNKGNHVKATSNPTIDNSKKSLKGVVENFSITNNSFSNWFWLGGGILTVSSLILLISKKKKKKEIGENEDLVARPINQQQDNESSLKCETPKKSFFENSSADSDLILDKLDQLKKSIHYTDQKEFYKLQESILCNAAMKKTKINLANFSEESIAKRLIEEDVDVQIVEQWKLLLNNAQKAKYAFGGLNQDLEKIYNETCVVTETLVK